MKKSILLAIAAIMALSACSTHQRPLPEFVHGCYSVKTLLTDEELSCPQYDDYDFMYLMALPEWWKFDFDCSREEARAFAESFDYAQADSNMARVPKMIQKCHEEGVKILLCCNGGEIFVPFMEKPSMLETLADYLVRMVELWDYDGIDMDWEVYFNKEQHVDLVTDLRAQLDSLSKVTGKDYYTTSALSIDHYYDEELAAKLAACHDWINIMSYDMGGGIWYSKATHNTPLDSLEYKMTNNYRNVPNDKICIGLASYGFYYKGVQPNVDIHESLVNYGRYITYREFQPWLDEGWTEEFDPIAQTSYFFSPDRNEFVTMETKATMYTKIKWVTEQKYRGIFWWEYHHDYLRPAGDGTPGEHPLVDVVSEYLDEQGIREWKNR